MKKKALCAAVLLGVVIVMGITAAVRLRWSVEWEAESSREINKFLANSERGFYNMRGVIIRDDAQEEAWLYDSIRSEHKEETLELLQIHIGFYRDREISPQGVEQIRKVFQAYREREKRVSLIVRFLYDWEGKGAENDPASLNVALRHMEQLGEIVTEYEDQVYIVQGVLVGSWAEMHSSRYLAQDSYLALIRKMDEAMPDSVYLAVRTPAYWRTAAQSMEPLSEEEAWKDDNLAARLSLFNDGILGNELDCGTYGDISKESAASFQDRWIREDELLFQKTLNLYVPNGGEVVLSNPLNDTDNAHETFETMHISYLNNAHDTEVLEKWKESRCQEEGSVYEGLSGYDWIERHLGYRFVIREVSATQSGWKWEDQNLKISIENVGYAPRYTPCRVEVILREPAGEGEKSLTVDTDVREWRPGETIAFTVRADLQDGKEYEVWLKVTGEKDQEPVLFASENPVAEDGSYCLGRIRKGD